MRLWSWLILMVIGATAASGLEWCDGTRDGATAPPGKLLSDNAGYWGDVVLTGVDYAYETVPDNPADIYRDKADRPGRRLLDGRFTGNWWVPVGVNGKPLVVVLDFKRLCTFSEIDVATRNKKLGIRLELRATAADPWAVVYERSLAEAPEAMFCRVPLPDKPRGRYLRVTATGEGISWLEEVLAWGDAEVSDQVPEAYQPVAPLPVAAGISFSSIPGIASTTFSDAQYWDWQRAQGAAASQPAVWSLVPTWDSVTDKPLLPAGKPLATVDVVMARNETESVALALTSTTCEAPRDLQATLSEVRPAGQTKPAEGLTGQLRIAGAIPSRQYGTVLGPLLSADNMPGRSLLKRYLTNGEGVAGFPQVTLSPAGSAVLWLSLTSDGVKPGLYETRLGVTSGPSVLVRVRVLEVTLPRPRVWLMTWSGVTGQFPFVQEDRTERELAYKAGLGVTVWNGWPEAGTPQALARKTGQPFFQIWGIGDYGHKLYNGQIDPAKLTAEDEAKIAELIHGHVAKAQSFGLSYDDWYVELTDEPGKGNSPAFGALCRIIRKIDPKVRIYCNPSFWVGNGVLGDDDVSGALGPWYKDCIDVSVPIYLLLRDRPKTMELFDSPRAVRASYTVSTQSAKGERSPLVELYRTQAWEAFSRGWSGWGFYAYFAPRGNPWSDMDGDWFEDLPDYEMVYPGPKGPVATRQSEAVREGWEDYCLLTLLKQRGKTSELQAIVKAWESGKANLSDLRRRALDAAAR